MPIHISMTIMELFYKVREEVSYLCKGEENWPNQCHPYNQGPSTAKLQGAKLEMKNKARTGMKNFKS